MPVSVDGDFQGIVHHLSLDRQAPALGHRFAGIANQVGEDNPHLIDVTQHKREG